LEKVNLFSTLFSKIFCALTSNNIKHGAISGDVRHCITTVIIG